MFVDEAPGVLGSVYANVISLALPARVPLFVVILATPNIVAILVEDGLVSLSFLYSILTFNLSMNSSLLSRVLAPDWSISCSKAIYDF